MFKTYIGACIYVKMDSSTKRRNGFDIELIRQAYDTTTKIIDYLSIKIKNHVFTIETKDVVDGVEKGGTDCRLHVGFVHTSNRKITSQAVMDVFDGIERVKQHHDDVSICGMHVYHEVMKNPFKILVSSDLQEIHNNDKY